MQENELLKRLGGMFCMRCKKPMEDTPVTEHWCAVCYQKYRWQRQDRIDPKSAHWKIVNHPVVNLLKENFDTAILGGAVRDVFHRKEPNDIDCVVDASSNDLEALMRAYAPKRNAFGGFRIPGKPEIDVWALRDSWGIRHAEISDPSFYHLIETVPFDVDSLALQLTDSRIISFGYFEAMQKKEMEVLYPPVAFPAKYIARAMYLRKRYSLTWGPALQAYVRETGVTSEVTRILKDRYGMII